MPRKKQNNDNNFNQLELFDSSVYVKNNSDLVVVVKSTDQIDSQFSPNAVDEPINETISVASNDTNKNKISETANTELIIPETYEDTLKQEINQQKIAHDLRLMAQFITPVIEFEEKIIQVVSQIKRSGYLLFLYGVSGVGKSTFISSLEWRTHIPIKKIKSINARNLNSDESGVKLKKLLKHIDEVTKTFFQEINSQPEQEKLCIVIDYLENLQDEDAKNVRAFFRDLNGLLREYPILIVWPVTDRQDLKTMEDFAKTFSSTMFYPKIPTIEFTGPPIREYPTIAKNTIAFFNQGRSCYEFQLNDDDFDKLKKKYEQKPKDRLIIRDYLREIREVWQERTKYTQKLMQAVPKPTEVWFIFSYPEAESVVAQFAKQSDNINEMWNANYNPLYTYIKDNNQRSADWPPGRLTLALSGILTTKIMYLPTNALVSCIAAYSKEAKIPISEEEFIQEYGVNKYWFTKQNAQRTLSATPLYLQLSGRHITAGKRKSGTVKVGLINATAAFEKINQNIVDRKISDHRFNISLHLALKDLFQESTALSFSCEKPHPNLPNIRPDILVNIRNEKYIALEFCYTINNTPGNLADYVLRKLNAYMKQLEQSLGIKRLDNFR